MRRAQGPPRPGARSGATAFTPTSFTRPATTACSAYNDFRELLARPDIEAVLIAVPYHWAALLATMAMRAGKDVYCEKPIAITVREGRNMADTVQRYSRIYQAGTQQRSEYGGKFRHGLRTDPQWPHRPAQGGLFLPHAGSVLPQALDLRREEARAQGTRLEPVARAAALATLSPARPDIPSPDALSAT